MLLVQPVQAGMESAVDRFAKLALVCVHQEYPNKIAHVMSSDLDVAPPRELTPVFYGCFDWHSSAIKQKPWPVLTGMCNKGI